MPSSARSTSPVGVPSAPRIGTGTSSSANQPESVCSAARRWLSAAKASISSRVTPYLSARTWATQNWTPSTPWHASRNAGLNGPTPPRALLDIGARVMDSTPQAIARSYAPAMTP